MAGARKDAIDFCGEELILKTKLLIMAKHMPLPHQDNLMRTDVMSK